MILVDFKDETDQTAAEYHVVPVSRQQSTGRSSSETSTPSSTMDSSLTTPNLAIPRSSYFDSKSNSETSHSSNTPIGQARLNDVSEAYLLRHFQKHLAPWVGHSPFYRWYP